MSIDTLNDGRRYPTPAEAAFGLTVSTLGPLISEKLGDLHNTLVKKIGTNLAARQLEAGKWGSDSERAENTLNSSPGLQRRAEGIAASAEAFIVGFAIGATPKGSLPARALRGLVMGMAGVAAKEVIANLPPTFD